MGRVRELNFSSSRNGLAVTVSNAFRQSMFSLSILRYACAKDSGCRIAPGILAKAQDLLSDIADRGPWDAPSVLQDAIYTASRFNYCRRTVGLQSEDVEHPLALADPVLDAGGQAPSLMFQTPVEVMPLAHGNQSWLAFWPTTTCWIPWPARLGAIRLPHSGPQAACH